MRPNIKGICSKLIFSCILLSLFAFISSGCSSSTTPVRGKLPYYSLSNPLLTMAKVGTLEQEYQTTMGAAIVKLKGSPKYYENDIFLKPGSPEEKLFLKSGAESPKTNKYYTFDAEIVQVIDDRNLTINQNDVITLKNVFTLSINDPLYQYYQVNPSQEYLIFLLQEAKDKENSIFWYSIRAAYYVKSGAVFATNNAESIDSYSGRPIDEFAGVLKGIEIEPVS
jgi:hypothetical protein